jgi:hypothetical protein
LCYTIAPLNDNKVSKRFRDPDLIFAHEAKYPSPFAIPNVVRFLERMYRMSVDERVLTRKGYEQLERELNKLEKITLPEIAERLTDLKSEVESEQEDPELFELLNRKDYCG